MGLAKSAPAPEGSVPVIEKVTPTGYQEYHHRGVPIDIYSYFDMPMERSSEKEIERLTDIHSWAMDGVETLGDAMQKIRSLETRLGQPGPGMKRSTKLWQWIALKKQIDDRLKRQDALENRRNW